MLFSIVELNQPFCIAEVNQLSLVNIKRHGAAGQQRLSWVWCIDKKAVETVAPTVVAIKAVFRTYPQVAVWVFNNTKNINTPNGAGLSSPLFIQGRTVGLEPMPIVPVQSILGAKPQETPAIFQHVIDRPLR